MTYSPQHYKESLEETIDFLNYQDYNEFMAREIKQMKRAEIEELQDKEFSQWLVEVDKICVAHFGLGHMDLPDALWRDMFEEGMSPHNGVDVAVYDAWYDMPGIEELWNV